MILLQLILLISSFCIITFFDKKIWGTILTPTVVLIWPFLILLISSYLYLEFNADNQILNYQVIPIWFLGVVFFWSGSLFIKLIFLSDKNKHDNTFTYGEEMRLNKSLLRSIIIISIPLALFVVYQILNLLPSFNYNFANADFQKKLGSGITAHIIMFLTFITILLIIFFEKSYLRFLQLTIIILTLIFSILYGVKSWVIIPLMSGFLGRILIKRTKPKLVHALVVVIPFAVFWLIYQLSFGMDKSHNDFIFNHMMHYLLAGPLGLSEHLNNHFPVGVMEEYPFIPLINLFRHISGEELLSPVSEYFVTIPTGLGSNVKTFFGTLYIYGGVSYVVVSLWFGILFSSFFMSFLRASKTSSPQFFTALYAFTLGILFLGWFELYVMHLAFYEVPIIALLLHLFSKIRII